MLFISLKKVLLSLGCCLLWASCANAQSSGVPWRAQDALGRDVQAADQVGNLKPDKKVGIFYFLWLQEADKKAPWNDGPYDLAKLFKLLPKADLKKVEQSENELWGTPGTYFFWDEPLYGYYSSSDPWVIRRHIQLLATAGVDFLVFDTTNNVTYPEVVEAICKTLLQMKKEGAETPQITFMLNTNADQTADKLWNEVYSKEEYQDLLFQLDGKPLLIGDPNVVKNENVLSKLTLRKAHWPFTMVDTEKAWHWEAAYPQPYCWSESPDKPEQVNVSVAQNLSRAPNAQVTPMSSGLARGRSFHNGVQEELNETDRGNNFAEQWERAYELNPDYVMITGWNEWIAGRWPQGGKKVFVDQFDREYSRDIEPMKGGHLDNYYLQMAQGIRRYKGAPSLPVSHGLKTVDVDGDFNQWDDVDLIFTDSTGETIPRDYPGTGKTYYTNNTGRNDFILSKAARDSENFYFYIETKDPIVPSTPKDLYLLINADNDLSSGFIGGDYLIGSWFTKTETGVNAFNGNKSDVWRWKSVGKVKYQCKDNKLMIAVPFETLGLSPESATFDVVSFKWLDNLGKDIEISDLYTNGDVAPESRFFFQATEK